MKEDILQQGQKLSNEEVREAARVILNIKNEIKKVIAGQEEVIDSLICALLCNGHVLVEGVPGIAKTLLIKSLAQVTGCSFKRIQFTVDLLPSDILGLTTYNPESGFEIVKGPIFANFIIADEINRSPPKTQSALIEAMQERQVTIGNTTFLLPSPFFVMANQNPIESEGVYNLPEAQIDRFIFKVLMGYPKKDDELRIMEENATLKNFEDFHLNSATSAQEILYLQQMVHRVYLDQKIKEYILNLVNLTRSKDFEYGNYIELGSSPRASIYLFISSKALALIKGRNYVIPKDVKEVAPLVLRHRLILSYKARADGITSDKIIESLLRTARVP